MDLVLYGACRCYIHIEHYLEAIKESALKNLKTISVIWRMEIKELCMISLFKTGQRYEVLS